MRTDTEVRSPAPGAPASTAGAKAGSRTPYADAARDLYRRGLFPIPCEGDDGKKPCGVQCWQRMKRPPEALIKRLVKEHAAANVGVVMGASSRCTVVDVDDSDQVDEIRGRCGETRLVTRTPSGGVHLWYRHDGEHCRNLRRVGLNADVKGQGGMIVVPPSFNRSNGRPYEFETGSWDDLSRLPKIRPGALDLATSRGSRSDNASMVAVPQGQRNTWLFHKLLHFAVKGADLESILKHAHACNRTCAPPLPEDEVRRVAHRAWTMTARGDNWTGGEQRVILTRSEFELLAATPDAFALLAKLRLAHEAVGEPFAVAVKAMKAAGVMPGWSAERLRKARDTLESLGFLRLVRKGGRCPGDPNLYVLVAFPAATRVAGHIPIQQNTAPRRYPAALPPAAGAPARGCKAS